MTPYKLYLDDLRNPISTFNSTKLPVYKEDWVVVRSFKEFVQMIEAGGLPTLISFDHDLHEEHVEFFIKNGGVDNPPDPLSVKFSIETGYDCAKWLINYCEEKKLDFPEYLVHSVNTIGSLNIKNLIENYKKSLTKRV